jgi:hypothetical protein
VADSLLDRIERAILAAGPQHSLLFGEAYNEIVRLQAELDRERVIGNGLARRCRDYGGLDEGWHPTQQAWEQARNRTGAPKEASRV